MKNLILMFVLLLILNLSATIIYIPADQPTIQDGIIASVDTDTVLVQPGIYVENINFNGKAITVASLFLTSQDTTYISQTIIDGNENGSVVRFESGEDNNSFLLGFTITSGYVQGNYPNNGGGIYCECSSPVLKNLMISENTAYTYGGGVYCGASSNPEMENIIISMNVAYGGGGGLYCEESSNPNLENITIKMNGSEDGTGGLAAIDSSPSLTDVIISENYSYDNVAGIFLFNSNSSLTNVHIEGNWGIHWGGSGICMNNSSPILTNVIITNHSVSENGAGMICYSSNPSLVNVTISDNFAYSTHTSYGGGAGIYCSYNSLLNLNNVVITGNYSGAYGGAIHCSDSSVVNLENVTIRDNYAYSHGGGIYCDNSFLNFSEENRCSIYSNTIENIAGLGKDLYVVECEIIDVIVDTFTVMIPSDYYAYPINNFIFNILNSVGVNENEIQLLGLNLNNFPNPFNPTTKIEFSIQNESEIELSIFNIKGQKIKTLTNNEFTKGSHSIIWNGDDEFNNPVSSGIYYYKLNVDDKTEAVKKCLLLK